MQEQEVRKKELWLFEAKKKEWDVGDGQMLPADMNKAFFFPSYKMHTLGIFGRLVFFQRL